MSSRDVLEIRKPYLLFLADARDELAAKTARGIADWRPEWCVGQLRLPGCKADVGLPDLTLQEAVARGAQTMVIGVANAGGVLDPIWIETIVAAIETGLDVATLASSCPHPPSLSRAAVWRHNPR